MTGIGEAPIETVIAREEVQVVKEVTMGSIKLGGTKFDIVFADGRSSANVGIVFKSN